MNERSYPCAKAEEKQCWHVPRAGEPVRLTGGELALQLLEDGVLRRGLRPPSQRLGGRAGEHGGDVGDVLQAHPKRAHKLLDKVQGVGGDFGIGHRSAFLKGDRVALGQALLELPENLVERDRTPLIRELWIRAAPTTTSRAISVAESV